jgi:catechol 2,3-dioxygenase-like lactoylglutathione lyase family enzyme
LAAHAVQSVSTATVAKIEIRFVEIILSQTLMLHISSKPRDLTTATNHGGATMNLPARISIATLGVSDLARSTKFYLALGWELAPGSSSEISFFRTAGGVLALYPFDLLAKDAMLAAVRSQGFGGVTLAINVERPEDVQPGLDVAKQAGATILKQATKADWEECRDISPTPTAIRGKSCGRINQS